MGPVLLQRETGISWVSKCPPTEWMLERFQSFLGVSQNKACDPKRIHLSQNIADQGGNGESSTPNAKQCNHFFALVSCKYHIGRTTPCNTPGPLALSSSKSWISAMVKSALSKHLSSSFGLAKPGKPQKKEGQGG